MLVTEFLNLIHDAIDRDHPLEDQQIVIESSAGVEFDIDRVYCVGGTGVGIDIKERLW